jgi:SAM-dependent methyltransferase
MSTEDTSVTRIETAAVSEGQRSAQLSRALDSIVSCPYCGSNNSVLYCRGRAAIILHCLSCGGFYDPDRKSEVASDRDVAAIVTRDYINSYQDNNSSELAIARGVIALLREQLPAARRFLEVGCGNAAIATVAAAERLPIGYIGIEVSPALYGMIDPAVRRLVVHERALETAFDRIDDGSQDVVIFHHVLEHLPEPRKVLALARRKLARDGRVFIEVPNEQWKRPLIRLRRILKPGGEDWFPGHINFFTQASLRKFLVAQGWEVEYERKVTAADYVEMVTKMLGGQTAFRRNVPAKIVHAALRLTKLESLIGYGIVLRCICRPT